MKISLKIFLFLCLFATNSIALQFKELYTDKGVKFWFVQDNTIPIVSISYSFKGGSFLDPPGKHGVSNLMTSLLQVFPAQNLERNHCTLNSYRFLRLPSIV